MQTFTTKRNNGQVATNGRRSGAGVKPRAEMLHEKTPEQKKREHIQAFAKHLMKHLDETVKGQSEMNRILVAAVITGMSVCIVGKSGLGKTQASRELTRRLGVKGNRFAMNPGITPFDITGSMVYDQAEGKKVYWPSPFLRGASVVFVDELNRSTRGAQDAVADVLEERLVELVSGEIYPVRDTLTVIMAMNPPDSDGTAPLNSHLEDRIGYTLYINTPSKRATLGALDKHCKTSPANAGNDVGQPTAAPSSYARGEAEIRKCREFFGQLRADTPTEVRNAANDLMHAFQSGWGQPATVRNAKAMIDMATITAIIERAAAPTMKDVRKAAFGCLSHLRPEEGWESNDQRLQIIERKLEEVQLLSGKDSTGLAERSSAKKEVIQTSNRRPGKAQRQGRRKQAKA